MNSHELLNNSMVLLAERSVPVIRLMTFYLDRAKARVVTCNNGSAAIDAARKSTFDIVILDLDLPVISGIQVANELRRGGSTVPIVGLTTADNSNCKGDAIAGGMTTVLLKPVKEVVLCTTITNCLRPNSTSTHDSAQSNVNRNAIEVIGDDKILLEIVSEFANELGQRLDTLTAFLLSQDWRSLVRAAHSLKGAAKNCGYRELAERAYQVEKAASSSNRAGVEETFKLLSEESVKVVNALPELQKNFPY